jgi:hypothetical protein
MMDATEKRAAKYHDAKRQNFAFAFVRFMRGMRFEGPRASDFGVTDRDAARIENILRAIEQGPNRSP